MKPANYNAVLAMIMLRGLGWFAVCLVFASVALAADWTIPVTELSKAISSATGPGTISLSVVNSSSISREQVAEIQRAIEAQLRAAGVRVGSGTGVNSEVRLTLSESLKEFVWVAEIRQGNQVQVEMVSAQKELGESAAKSSPAVEIRKALMWSEPHQILDMLMLDAATPSPKLMILAPDSITLDVLSGGKWKHQQTWAITHTRNYPRDLRGLLVANSNREVEAYLPGTVCSIGDIGSGTIFCREGDDAWKIGPRSAFFNSARNYFTGALVPPSDKPMSPFYSIAWLNRQGYQVTVIVGVDGHVRVSDGVNERLLPGSLTADWGSDIVGVKTGCGSGAQLLATSAGDDTRNDSLRAYDIQDRNPVLVSAATDFPGPITALWSHDGTSATAIVHNLQTEQYEAYSISVICTQ